MKSIAAKTGSSNPSYKTRKLKTVEEVRKVLFSGNAQITIEGSDGARLARFTYQVRRPDPDSPYFVWLGGRYVGALFGGDEYRIHLSRRSAFEAWDPPVELFQSLLLEIEADELEGDLEVWKGAA